MSAVPTLRLGTRRSALARTQSQWVADRIEKAAADAGAVVRVELVEIVTRGDTSTAPLASFGGVGVFVSRLREALLAGEVDIAVHCLKDLPTAPAEGLVLAAVPIREDPPRRARGPRRPHPGRAARGRADRHRLAPSRRPAARARAGPRDRRPARQRRHPARLVQDGALDAVVLARAGLARLGRLDEATEVLDPLLMLPAPGQGALAVECRDPRRPDGSADAADEAVVAAVRPLDDPATRAAVTAERVLLATLEAGCAAPLGALAEVVDDEAGPLLSLRAVAAAVGRLGDPASLPHRSGRPTRGRRERPGRAARRGRRE